VPGMQGGCQGSYRASSLLGGKVAVVSTMEGTRLTRFFGQIAGKGG